MNNLLFRFEMEIFIGISAPMDISIRQINVDPKDDIRIIIYVSESNRINHIIKSELEAIVRE